MDYVRCSISWGRTIFKPHPQNRILVPLKASLQNFPTNIPLPFVWESLPGTTGADNVSQVSQKFNSHADSNCLLFDVIQVNGGIKLMCKVFFFLSEFI